MVNIEWVLLFESNLDLILRILFCLSELVSWTACAHHRTTFGVSCFATCQSTNISPISHGSLLEVVRGLCSPAEPLRFRGGNADRKLSRKVSLEKFIHLEAGKLWIGTRASTPLKHNRWRPTWWKIGLSSYICKTGRIIPFWKWQIRQHCNNHIQLQE